jgi:SAM-dependent methyltransferase
MSLIELPRVVAERPDRPDLGDLTRRMQELTRAIALEPGAWTPDRKAHIASLFDAMAAGWRERDRPERHEALADALARGGPYPSGWCAEVGSGTGNATADLRRAFDDVVSLDLSGAMLQLASQEHRLLQSDASALPVRTGSVSVVALVNMFLFPAEVARVLADDGVLLWVSTNGDATPIYLPPADVVHALPGAWEGVTAGAGWGVWCTARRAPTRTPRVGRAGAGATR